MADYNKLLQVPRGTKARLEEIKLDLLVNTLVYATDTKELGIKLSNGNIEYFKNAANINAIMTGKQDKLFAGDNITIDENNLISSNEIDLNMLGYMNYAADIYYRARRQSLFSNAWESSLEVDPSEIIVNSSSSSPGGKAQYPNGETEGVIIPQGVTSIGDYAFMDWQSNNQPLVIPNSVTSIGDGAFQNWTSNNQPLVIPDSVTSIGSAAFAYWQANNQPLVIPDSVTSIGKGAFMIWPLVPYVEIQAITPPTLAGMYEFEGQNNAPIYVPNESVDDYKEATNWVSLADRIFPISDKTDVIGDILALETANMIKSITRSGSNLFTITYYDDTTSSLLTLAELKTFIGEATQSLSGLMSAQDKVDLDTLMALFDEDGDSVVNTIAEVLVIFNNYPEDADLVTALAGKVDKVTGMGLSSNDFTTTEKNKLSGIQTGAQVNAVTTVAGRTGAVVLAKADVGLGSVQNYGISSQAQAIAGTVNTVYMTPLRTKEAITAAMGDIENALDAILGV